MNYTEKINSFKSQIAELQHLKATFKRLEMGRQANIIQRKINGMENGITKLQQFIKLERAQG